jgi:hypothetical protein
MQVKLIGNTVNTVVELLVEDSFEDRKDESLLFDNLNMAVE